MLGILAVVVVDHEVIAGDENGEPSEDGGTEASTCKIRIIFWRQIHTRWGWKISQIVDILCFIFCLFLCNKLVLMNFNIECNSLISQSQGPAHHGQGGGGGGAGDRDVQVIGRGVG